MKTFFKVLKILLKIFLCLLLSIFFIGSIGVELIVVGAGIEIIFFIMLSLFMVLITWVFAFVKIKKINVFSKIIIFVLAFFLYMKLPLLLPNVREAWDKDICLDSGVCSEGTTNIKDKHGKLVPINKENCINNGYKWYEKSKSCNLRKK